MSLRLFIPFFLFSLLLISCRQSNPPVAAVPFRISDSMWKQIQIDTVTEQNVQSQLRFSGKIVPQDNKIARIFPVVAGFVTSVNVSLGDYVKKGQVLASIRSTDMAAFDKQRRDAETDLALARKNWKTIQELYASRLTTERELAVAEKELETQEAELRRINEVLRIYHASEGSSYTVISPLSGFVIDKKITADMQLPEGLGESLFTIAQIDEVVVDANVYETDIAALRPGMPVSVQLVSYPDKSWNGKIDQILSVLDPETRTLKFKVRLPNPDLSLKPEMAATVTVYKNEEQRLPRVPSQALVFDKSKNFLLVYHGRDSVETRAVQAARSINGHTYIQSGIRAGEQIISRNGLLIYDALND